MAKVTQGVVTAEKSRTKSAPKVAKIVQDEQAKNANLVAYISREGADGAWVIPPGQKFHPTTGAQIGYDPGVHLDFRGVGVTGPFDLSNPVHREQVARVDALIADNYPIVNDLGLERLAPDAPRPLFAKWDRLSGPALRIAIGAVLGEDHDENVRVVKECARYELANGNRADVLAVLDGFLAHEAADSDEFSVEVTVS